MIATIFWNMALATIGAILLVMAGRFRRFQSLPALRHLLWLLVLAKFVTPPLLPVPVLPVSNSRANVDRNDGDLAAARTKSFISSRPLANGIQPEDAAGSVGIAAETGTTAPGLEPIRQASHTEGSFITASGTNWFVFFAGLSFCGTISLWIRDIAKTLQLARLLHRATPGGIHLQQLATHAALSMRATKVPQVYIVAGRVTPFLWAGRKPIVALPLALVDELDDAQIDCVISHELAHFRRRDHWANAFAFLVASLFWWHPAVWLARRELRAAQDLCCDALVIDGDLAKRQCYAETLLRAVEFVALGRPELPALASEFGSLSSITRRFEMIADPRVHHRLPRWSYVIVAGIVAFMLCAPTRRPDLHSQEIAIDLVGRASLQGDEDAEIANPSWRLIHLIHPAHRQGIWHLAFSPDGKTIASAAADSTTRLWDVKSGRLRETIERPIKCNCVAFSPDGKMLAIAGGDSGEDPSGELILWNLAQGVVEKQLLEHTTAKYVRWTAFSPDGQWLAAGGTDKSVKIWNVAKGTLHRTLPGHTALVHSVAFSPDGTRLASGSFDHSIRIWDLNSGKSLAILEGHEAEVRMVAFAPEGNFLLSTSEDKTARLWDTEIFEPVTIMEGHEGWVLCGAFAPDGRKVVTAGKTSGGQRVLLRDVASGDWGDMGLFPSQTSDIMSVAFSPDGDLLAIAGGFDDFQIWKRADNQLEEIGEEKK